MTVRAICFGLLACLCLGSTLGDPGEEGCFVSVAPPEYYTIDLVSTKRVPGSARAKGTGEVYYASTPFGISLSENGSYLYNLDISINDLLQPRNGGHYVAWVTTPQIDQVVRIGTLDGAFKASGVVAWNKFLVVITLEEEDDVDAASWSGPVVLRGISRSGLMHTMAGHGPFEDEPCAIYGY